MTETVSTTITELPKDKTHFPKKYIAVAAVVVMTIVAGTYIAARSELFADSDETTDDNGNVEATS